jgi:hypothetical protein
MTSAIVRSTQWEKLATASAYDTRHTRHGDIQIESYDVARQGLPKQKSACVLMNKELDLRPV